MSKLYNETYSNFENSLLDKVRKHIECKKAIQLLQLTSEDTVLEVGCDRGELVRKLEPLCKKVIGIDTNEFAIQHSLTNNCFLMDTTDLKFPDENFDKIVSLQTVEHIPDLGKAFKELGRVLKPEGKIVLIYPREFIRGERALRDALVVEHNPRMATQLHLHKLNPERIERFCKSSGLEIDTKGIFFSPFPCWYTVLRKR